MVWVINYNYSFHIGWIGPVLADETKSLCKICKCTLAAHKKDLLLHGKNSKYSLIIDEHCSRFHKNAMRYDKYFSKKQTKIVTTFYKLIEIEKGDAITISAAVTKQLELDGLKLGNLIGIGVDGANVMIAQFFHSPNFLNRYFLLHLRASS
ncbi:unnamed protein product [Acanthoscelides obtectus]|uniref:Uncharacterized protein n=1 Tax=Acanthoscelides obtectus TaxID=200917 RepID=A0A9P0VTN2_ACAOB|nr:unnamed protein product [Acanthoscelides obtectus]CAK1689303.1 hypothetical protein AOBTE_LOCUS37156 [Acanthoscelides obtectus]